MKKTLLTFLALTAFGFMTYAQSIYIRGALGLAMPAAGQSLDYSGTPYSGNLTLQMVGNNREVVGFEANRVSFNTGIQAHFGLGLMLSKHAGFDLGFSFGLAHNIYKTTRQFPDDPYYYTQTFSTYAKSPVMMMPALVLQSGGEKLNIYTRAGLALPLRSTITTEITEVVSVPSVNITNSTIRVEEQLRSDLSLGFAGAAGVKYALSPRMEVMLELSGVALSVYARESEWTMYSENGNVVPINQIPEEFRVTRYSKNYKVGSEPSYSLPFSNVGFNAGVCMKL